MIERNDYGLKIMLGFDCDRPRGDFIKTEEGMRMAQRKIKSLQEISKTLQELEIPRTFFVCGQFLESMSSLFGKGEIKKVFGIDSSLVEIGDHSYSHSVVKKIKTRPDKIPITPEEVVEEFKKNTKIFKEIFDLNITKRAFRTPLGHSNGLEGENKILNKLRDLGVKYVSSDLRDENDGLKPPLENKDKTPRQPYFYENGLLEIPSMGWQDTVFSKTSKTPTQEKIPESYEEIIEYYDRLFREANEIAQKNNIVYFLGLVLHPYDNSFYNKDNKFFCDIYNIVKGLKADFCKYEDVASSFNRK